MLELIYADRGAQCILGTTWAKSAQETSSMLMDNAPAGASGKLVRQSRHGNEYC
jgi:hypothetical protein